MDRTFLYILSSLSVAVGPKRRPGPWRLSALADGTAGLSWEGSSPWSSGTAGPLRWTPDRRALGDRHGTAGPQSADGDGKTHLAIALGVKPVVAENRCRVWSRLTLIATICVGRWRLSNSLILQTR